MEHPLTRDEIEGIAISAAALTAGFTVLYFWTAGGGVGPIIAGSVVTGVLVAVSFIPHVMAHRLTARSMDAYAEYELWLPGAAVAVLTGFLGFVFAATGGIKTYTRTGERYGLMVPELDVKMIGYMALAGPLINISLSVLFAFAATTATVPTVADVNVLELGSRINSFIALATLVPVYPMDGYKVLRFSTRMWLLTIGMAVLSFFLI